MGELKNRILKNLIERRDRVLDGKVNCLPLPFPRFREEWPGVEQSTYYLITGATKSAKTQFTNFVFVYNTVMWCYKHPDIIRPKIFYFPLEETAEQITLRFMAFLIFYITKGEIVISPTDLKSTNEEKPLPDKVLEVMNTEEYNNIMDYYESVITFYDDMNVTGICKVISDYAHSNGTTYYKTIKVKVTDDFGNVSIRDRKLFDYYVPNDERDYNIVIVDHVSLLHPEKNMDLRESICKLSENFVQFRNRYKFIPVVVQQQSTETTSLDAFKNNKIRPTVAGLADGKYTSRDCTMMIGLTNPNAFELPEYQHYDITKFGGNMRFFEVVLNREGKANGICPLIFRGEINFFKEAPNFKDTSAIERELINLSPLKHVAFALFAYAKKLFKWQTT